MDSILNDVCILKRFVIVGVVFTKWEFATKNPLRKEMEFDLSHLQRIIYNGFASAVATA